MVQWDVLYSMIRCVTVRYRVGRYGIYQFPTNCFKCFILQCCGSRMLILYPGSWFLSVTDSGSNNNKRGGGKISGLSFFCNHKFHKFFFYIFLYFYSKNCHLALENRGRGCGIRKKAYPRCTGQKRTGSRFWICSTRYFESDRTRHHFLQGNLDPYVPLFSTDPDPPEYIFQL